MCVMELGKQCRLHMVQGFDSFLIHAKTETNNDDTANCTIARPPIVVSKCCVLLASGMNDLPVTFSQTRYVAVIEITFIDTFTGIMSRSNKKPFLRKWRQFEIDSNAATTIAAGPPNSKKVRKTAAS